MYYNPAFAGSKEKMNIQANSRFQTLSSKFDVYGPEKYFDIYSDVTIDHFVPAIKSGIGINLEYGNIKMNYSSNDDVHRHTGAGLVIAPKISINGRITLSPALKVGFQHQQSVVTFPHGYSAPDTNVTSFIQNSMASNSIHYTIGFLVNSTKFQCGFSTLLVIQLLKNEHGYSSKEMYFFNNSYFHVGYNWKRSEESKFSFTPIAYISINAVSHSQYFANIPHDLIQLGGGQNMDLSSSVHFYYLDYNLLLNFRYQKLLFGIDTKFQGMLGYQSDKFRCNVVAGMYESASLWRGQVGLQYCFN